MFRKYFLNVSTIRITFMNYILNKSTKNLKKQVNFHYLFINSLQLL